MVCTYVPLGNGQAAIVCGPRRRVKKCWCGAPGVKLCDFKVGQGKTCDIPRCERHSTHVAADKDLCEDHAEKWGARLAMFYAGTLQDAPARGGAS